MSGGFCPLTSRVDRGLNIEMGITRRCRTLWMMALKVIEREN